MGSAAVIVTGDLEKPKMSKCLLALLGIAIFTVLVIPNEEQKVKQKKIAEQNEFRKKFASIMMGSVSESEKCEKLEGEAQKKCLAQVMDKIKERMRKLRKEEEGLDLGEDEKVIPELDGLIKKADKMSESLRDAEQNHSGVEGEVEDKNGWVEDNAKPEKREL